MVIVVAIFQWRVNGGCHFIGISSISLFQRKSKTNDYLYVEFNVNQIFQLNKFRLMYYLWVDCIVDCLIDVVGGKVVSSVVVGKKIHSGH